MSALARPGPLAAVLTGAALALHPAVARSIFFPGHAVALAALLLLGALALGARAAAGPSGRAGAALQAAGAALAVAALAFDGVRGHAGTLTLAPGQSASAFEEIGRDGARLGLRPLGFVVAVERVLPGGEVVLALADRSAPVTLSRRRSLAVAGLRLAEPRPASPGGVSRLRVAARDGARTTIVEVLPGTEARAGELFFRLERYFPDFALDDKRQPYSRSLEPRNPAALLSVEKAGVAHRVFVLQAMPDVHRVEALGLSFSLIDVEPERAAEIAVHRQPAALGVLAGGLLLAVGAALLLRLRPAPAAHPLTPLLVGGAAYALALASVDDGSVLAWSFGVATATGHVALAGVGALFGGALVSTLGGTLPLLALRACGEGAAVTRPARAALWLAALLGVSGVSLAAVRLALLPGAARTWPLAALGLAVAFLALALVSTRPALEAPLARARPLLLPAGVVAALALALAVAVQGLLRDGSYATPLAASAAATALLGLASLEPTQLPGLRIFLFVVAFLGLALA